jgi:hypothetical protein
MELSDLRAPTSTRNWSVAIKDHREQVVVATILSEAGPDTIRRAHTVYPVAALQTEYS